jgi:hypothetical protein
MEGLLEPSEIILAHLDETFDPRRTSDSFVPFLARWVDLEPIILNQEQGSTEQISSRPLTTGLGRLRELIAEAAYLSQWRGTARGLLRFLETASGIHGFELDERVAGPDGLPRAYHIRICAPESTADHRALIEKIIEFEKPAHVSYELAFV